MSGEAVQTPGSTPTPGQAIIFGTDNRRPVGNTSASPWCQVGRVVSDYGYEMALGTGALIGNKTVLTAAHVIYDPLMGAPSHIYFIPAANGTYQPYGVIKSVSSYVPEEYKQGNQDYDLGLIVLDTEIGRQTGFFPLAMEPDSYFSNQPLQSAGYPMDISDGSEMFSVNGDSIGVEGVMLLHQITTEDGQSGAPLWFLSSGVPTIVGVNVGAEQSTGWDGGVTYTGLGTRFDTELGTLINNTLSQNGDVLQESLPAPSSSVPTSASGTGGGLCGMGAGQALVMLSLSWVACFARRSLNFAARG